MNNTPKPKFKNENILELWPSSIFLNIGTGIISPVDKMPWVLFVYESVQKTVFLTVPFVYTNVLDEGRFQNPFKLNRYVIESLLNKYQ